MAKSNLPIGWSVAALKELCVVNPKHDKSLPSDLFVTFLPMAAVSDLLGKITAFEVCPLGEVLKGYTHFAEGDVLFAKITPCMENGKSALAVALNNGLGCGSTEFFVFRSKGGVVPAYLHYYLRQESFRLIAKENMTGVVGQSRVPKPFLENVEIPLPPLNEQRRIAAKIEELQGRSKKAREALAEAETLLEQLRQSILHAAFTGKLTQEWREANPDTEPASKLLKRIRTERRKRWEEAELAKYATKEKTPPKGWQATYLEPVQADTAELPELPEGWCWASFGECFSVNIGATPSRKEPSYWGGNIPWVSSGEVAFCDIESTKEHISEKGLARSSTQINPVGTVLLGMIGEGKTRGQSAVLRIPAANNQNAAAILVSHTPISPEYIFFFLLWQYEKTRNIGSGNNQQALNKARVEQICFPLPPLSELSQIAACLSDKLATLKHLSETVTSIQQTSLQHLDQSILAKAFRGELVPQDPNDEPASELLKRTKAEVFTVPAKKRKHG